MTNNNAGDTTTTDNKGDEKATNATSTAQNFATGVAMGKADAAETAKKETDATKANADVKKTE